MAKITTRLNRLIIAISVFLLLISLPTRGDTDRPRGKSLSCTEILAQLGKTANSFYSAESIERSPLVKELELIYRHRSHREQLKVNMRLTGLHAQNEMTFQTKNPKTGFYDKFTAVPVNGIVAPIAASQFDKLVQSTAPLMRFLRHLLQRIYSGTDITPESLQLTGLSAADAHFAAQIIRESIYLEPALRAPQMREYPFLAVGGFDGAFGDPSNPDPIFFEMNLGTPSGISNNSYLMSYLQNADPSVYHKISPYLSENSTFKILRQAIESNALAWTKNPNGISVVISPGIYNGAHPDVAAVARFTGMPLVRASDLYEDSEQNIRLNTGPEKEHPIVTGVYGRAEESYFFQSNDDGIPLINPYYVGVNKELSEKLGFALRPGAIYAYIKNDAGQIVDVERDNSGKPLLQPVWDTIGADPARPDATRGSFASAVLNHKLYFSGLGGRVVDDKRLFRILAKLFESQYVARPVEGLDPSALGDFYADPANYVVKEPANSGGVGVHFLGLLSPEARNKIVEQVRANPKDFEIQRLREVTVLPTSERNQISDVATDMRIFVTMDSSGDVAAGPQSILLRTAKAGSLFSNTSQGGGYGIGVVYNDQSELPAQEAKPILNIHPARYISDSHFASLTKTVRESVDLLNGLTVTNISADEFRELQSKALELSYNVRDVLDILPGGATIFALSCRNFANINHYSAAVSERLQSRIVHFLQQVSAQDANWLPFADRLNYTTQWNDVVSKIPAQLKPFFIARRGFEYQNQAARTWQYQANRAAADKLALPDIRLQVFDQPEIAYWYDNSHTLEGKAELARYVSVGDPVVQKLIHEVEAAGGEVRYARHYFRPTADSQWQDMRHEGAYFWINYTRPDLTSYLRPIISIDLSQPLALAALRHEMAHFHFWLDLYQKYLKDGLADRDARIRAALESNDANMWVESERAAVSAEIQSEGDENTNPFNWTRETEPRYFYEPGYLGRITYPEIEGIRMALYRHLRPPNAPLDEKFVVGLMEHIVKLGESTRNQAMEFLSDATKYKPSLTDEKAKELLKSWNSNTLLLLVIPQFEFNRLQADGSYAEFMNLYLKVTLELGVSSFPKPGIVSPSSMQLQQSQQAQ